MTAKEKLNILEILIEQLKEQQNKCLVALEQSENDWIALNSCDGRVHSEIAIKIVSEMERLLND